MIKETLKFLREYYCIPRNKKMRWGIIEETTPEGTFYRLGVIIPGTDLYLDVARRRFYSCTERKRISRKIFPAVRKSCNELAYKYTAENGLYIKRSKTFIVDIYYPAIYSEELEKEGAL